MRSSSVSSARAFSPRLRLSFLTVLLGTASIASAQTIWMQFAPVSPALNSTDDFLIPFTLGYNKQIVNLAPSLGQTETSIIGPKACTPQGQKTAKDKCVLYRGGAFDQSKSTSFTGGTEEFNYRNQIYVTYLNGPLVKDTVHLSGDDGDMPVKDFQFALVESSNMTSGMLGLGKNSTFLQRLYDDGKIASKSFGLHVGVDIWNHPWPVLNPSFDESGNKPTTKDDFNTGTGKRAVTTHKNFVREEETDENQLPVRKSHKFPGSLTLGGYDRAKISNKTKPIQVPIAPDGTLQLSLKKMVARNLLPYSPYDLEIQKPLKVVIDADTPHMYFPKNISRGIGEFFGAVYGEPGYDFFYTSLADRERYLGNVTMTFTAPDGKGDEIEIMIPPTVWYQPIGYMRNFELVGDPYYNYYAPMREWALDQEASHPIILGRSFLKAAHLFVNYDSNHFQISQVAYTNTTQDIIAVAVDTHSVGNGTTKGNSNGTKKEEENKGSVIPVPILVGALGGAVVLIAALVLILCCLKKRRNREKTKEHQQLEDRPNTGVSDLPVGGRMELDTENVAMVKLSRPTTAVSHAEAKLEGTHAELPVKQVQTPPPELPAPGLYKQAELGGNSYAELGAKHDYHEMPSHTATPTTPPKAHTPVSPNPPMYPPPSHSPPLNMPPAPGFPGYNYQQYPPPPGSPPATLQQYPPPPGPPPPNVFPAGYVPPPPPPNPPPSGSPYTYVPHQYPGQVYNSHPSPNPDPFQRASLHEMA